VRAEEVPQGVAVWKGFRGLDQAPVGFRVVWVGGWLVACDIEKGVFDFGKALGFIFRVKIFQRLDVVEIPQCGGYFMSDLRTRQLKQRVKRRTLLVQKSSDLSHVLFRDCFILVDPLFAHCELVVDVRNV